MSRSVLLVDDDPAMLRLAESILLTRGLEVATALNGKLAIDRLRDQVPNVVVTDLEMPEMGGRDLVRHCRRLHPELPIVILTGTGSEEEAIQCFRDGAADYVVKTRAKTELLEVIEKLLEEPEPEPEPAAPPAAPAPPTAPAAPPSKPSAKPRDADESSAKDSLQKEYAVRKRRSVKDHPPAAKDPIRAEFIVRKWNLNQRFADLEAPASKSDDAVAERILSPSRLAMLRRQAMRLKKWGDLVGGTKKEARRHIRRLLSDVVEIVPVDGGGEPRPEASFQSFCKDVSSNGCGLLHHRSIDDERCVIRFPHLTSRSAGLLCEIVRSRRVALGMFEIGLKFIARVDATGETPAG